MGVGVSPSVGRLPHRYEGARARGPRPAAWAVPAVSKAPHLSIEARGPPVRIFGHAARLEPTQRRPAHHISFGAADDPPATTTCASAPVVRPLLTLAVALGMNCQCTGDRSAGRPSIAMQLPAFPHAHGRFSGMGALSLWLGYAPHLPRVGRGVRSGFHQNRRNCDP